MYATADVGDTDSDEGRRSVRVARHVHQAGKRLRDHIVAGLVGERAFPAERRK
jgi:hypothetical protein